MENRRSTSTPIDATGKKNRRAGGRLETAEGANVPTRTKSSVGDRKASKIRFLDEIAEMQTDPRMEANPLTASVNNAGDTPTETTVGTKEGEETQMPARTGSAVVSTISTSK